MLLLFSRDREMDLCETAKKKKKNKTKQKPRSYRSHLVPVPLAGNFRKKSKQNPKLGKKRRQERIECHARQAKEGLQSAEQRRQVVPKPRGHSELN